MNISQQTIPFYDMSCLSNCFGSNSFAAVWRCPCHTPEGNIAIHPHEFPLSWLIKSINYRYLMIVGISIRLPSFV